MEIEDEFGISIPDDLAEKISTVGDAIKFVEQEVANK
jgi:acyl carrier protein